MRVGARLLLANAYLAFFVLAGAMVFGRLLALYLVAGILVSMCFGAILGFIGRDMLGLFVVFFSFFGLAMLGGTAALMQGNLHPGFFVFVIVPVVNVLAFKLDWDLRETNSTLSRPGAPEMFLGTVMVFLAGVVTLGDLLAERSLVWPVSIGLTAFGAVLLGVGVRRGRRNRSGAQGNAPSP